METDRQTDACFNVIVKRELVSMQQVAKGPSLTVVSEIEVDKVENNVHEVLNTDCPRTVHVGAVWLRKRWRRDFSSGTSQQVRTTTSCNVRK